MKIRQKNTNTIFQLFKVRKGRLFDFVSISVEKEHRVTIAKSILLYTLEDAGYEYIKR